MNIKWQDGDRDFIRANAATMKDKDLAVALGKLTGREVTLDAVRKERQKLGIAKKPGRGICALTGTRDAAEAGD